MAAEKIGKARCPLCGGVASVSLSKNQLPVLTMNCCQAQLFARSDRSDMLVRGLMLPAEQQHLPISEKRPGVEDKGIRVPEDKPAAPAAASVAGVKKGMGLLGAWL